MVRVFLIAATAAVALAAPKKKVTPIACPQFLCANPAPCSYVPSALLNADGCPKHPCGIRTCKTTTAAPVSSSCCDPTNPTHLSHTTTCTVEKQSCADWVASIAAGQVHYKGANGFKKVLDLAHRACKESGDKPHYWVKVKHANPNAWERKSDNFKCARAGDAATPTAAAHCVCCECKDGLPHLAAATAAPTEAAKPTAAPVDANTIITTTKLSTPFKVKGLTVATFSEAAQAGVIAAVAKSAGVHRSQVTLANIKDAQARRLGGVSWESSTSRAVAFDIIIAVTDEASKGQAVQLLQDITVGGKAPEVAFAKLVVEDMTAAVLADKGTPPAIVAAVQAASIALAGETSSAVAKEQAGCYYKAPACTKQKGTARKDWTFNKSTTEAGKAACLAAAQQKHKACGGVQTEPVSYKWVDTLGTKAVTYPKVGCYFNLAECPKHPGWITGKTHWAFDGWRYHGSRTLLGKQACVHTARGHHGNCGLKNWQASKSMWLTEDGSTVTQEPKVLAPKPVDGKWTDFAAWTVCSKVCGTGTQTAKRACVGQAHGGKACEGQSSKTQSCNTKPCPVDGKWSAFGAWTACTRTCGTGAQSRARTCEGRAFGGADCEGKAAEQQQCSTNACPLAAVPNQGLVQKVTGTNVDSAKNLAACNGECDTDAQCATGLKCFQRSNGEGIPGCDAANAPGKDWDYCYDPRWTPTPLKKVSGGNSGSAKNLATCTGECDNDDQCAPGLKCFQRSKGEAIPGCDVSTAPTGDWDYCYNPNFGKAAPLVKVGKSNDGSAINLKACTGECDSDLQCGPGLKCFQRENGESIPGCDVSTAPDGTWDYCYDPMFGHTWPVKKVSGGNSASAKGLTACTGECDTDAQCGKGLKCFQRENGEAIPGCDVSTAPGKDWDYCYDPLFGEAGHRFPVTMVGGGNSGSAKGLKACHGECDNDGQCATGLKCFQRENGESIPGCDVSTAPGKDWDYCYDPEFELNQLLAAEKFTRDNAKTDCVEGKWAKWSTCTKQCGGGQQSRTRIGDVAAKNGGKACSSAQQALACNAQPCPINGKWSQWSSWSDCSKTCGGGATTRTRSCVGRAFGGKDCDGEATATKSCNGYVCFCPTCEVKNHAIIVGHATAHEAGAHGPRDVHKNCELKTGACTESHVVAHMCKASTDHKSCTCTCKAPVAGQKRDFQVIAKAAPMKAGALLNKPRASIAAVVDTKGTPSCDAALYMAAYPDLAKSFGGHADGGLAAAARHWLGNGKREGRKCPTGCDWKAYLARYADLEKAFGADLNKARTHYENNGLREGRHCGPSLQYCNWQNYLDRYADLATAFGADNVERAEHHFVNSGAKEGRNCA